MGTYMYILYIDIFANGLKRVQVVELYNFGFLNKTQKKLSYSTFQEKDCAYH